MRKILFLIIVFLLCNKANGYPPSNTNFVESYSCEVEDIIEFSYNPKKISTPKISNKYFKIELYQHNVDGKYAIDLEDNNQLEFLWNSNFAFDKKGPWLISSGQYFTFRWINKYKLRFFYLWHSGGELDSIPGYNPTWLIEGMCQKN